MMRWWWERVFLFCGIYCFSLTLAVSCMLSNGAKSVNENRWANAHVLHITLVKLASPISPYVISRITINLWCFACKRVTQLSTNKCDLAERGDKRHDIIIYNLVCLLSDTKYYWTNKYAWCIYFWTVQTDCYKWVTIESVRKHTVCTSCRNPHEKNAWGQQRLPCFEMFNNFASSNPHNYRRL